MGRYRRILVGDSGLGRRPCKADLRWPPGQGWFIGVLPYCSLHLVAAPLSLLDRQAMVLALIATHPARAETVRSQTQPGAACENNSVRIFSHGTAEDGSAS